jgi:hypothetical protein
LKIIWSNYNANGIIFTNIHAQNLIRVL